MLNETKDPEIERLLNLCIEEFDARWDIKPLGPEEARKGFFYVYCSGFLAGTRIERGEALATCEALKEAERIMKFYRVNGSPSAKRWLENYGGKSK